MQLLLLCYYRHASKRKCCLFQTPTRETWLAAQYCNGNYDIVAKPAPTRVLPQSFSLHEQPQEKYEKRLNNETPYRCMHRNNIANRCASNVLLLLAFHLKAETRTGHAKRCKRPLDSTNQFVSHRMSGVQNLLIRFIAKENLQNDDSCCMSTVKGVAGQY